MLATAPREKWYFKVSTMVIAVLCIGPFALPLIWFNPRVNKGKKILVSGLILFVSFFLGILMYNLIKNITSYYQTNFQ